ncbi:hypothetical protein FRC18_004612 [Serendipita sp. 400]|nr:hypothetical protein FRC18_004612 [Serendipita sp. 400]
MNTTISTQNVKNTPYSALNDDVLYHLCNAMLHMNGRYGLVTLSMVDRRNRMIATPFIFESISFYRYWDGSQQPWVGFDEKVEVILRNKRMLSSVRTANFRRFLYDTFKDEIPSGIFILLTCLPQLVELSINVDNLFIPQFRRNLEECSLRDLSGLSFPSSLRSFSIPNEECVFVTDLI